MRIFPFKCTSVWAWERFEALFQSQRFHVEVEHLVS